MMSYKIAVTLHLLASVIWVGGMFFAHMALRPAAQTLLEPPQRLPLLKGVLDRFFLWVWAAIITILVSGYWIFFDVMSAKAAIYVHVMQLIGLVMIALFSYLWFVPYRNMGRALASNDLPAAGAAMAVIRRVIGINLVLGVIELVLGAARPF